MLITAEKKLATGYKQTEIGIIPEDWDVKLLGNLFEITSSKRVFQSEWKSNGIPFYRARELAVLGEDGLVDNELFISHDMYRSFKANYGVPKKGDILVTGVGTLGKVYVVPDDREFYFKDGNIIWFKIGSNVNSNFLKQLYSTRLIIKQIEDASAGTTVGTYTISGAKKTIIPFPSLEEQDAIAEALAVVDALIAKQGKLIEKKKNIQRATKRQLLTGTVRLPGFKGGWKNKTLEEISDCLDNLRIPLNENQRSKMRGDIPYCGANGVLDYVNNYVVDDDIILIAEDGGYFDEYTYRPIAYRMIGKSWVNNHAHILKSKEGFDQGFLFYSLVHKNILSFLASGTRAKLNKSEMYKIEIAVAPTKEEQTAIAKVLSDMDAEIEKLESQLSKYQNIKQGMMQTLLTGKIRLISK